MQPIGIIHSPFKSLENMPIQPKGAAETVGTIVIEQKYQAGLADLDGFSHIYLIYQFHKVVRTELTVVPFMDNTPHGVFATRSPLRPNRIGLSIVELESASGAILTIKGVDVLDGTPLLDLKPYIAAFDQVGKSRSGWMNAAGEEVAGRRSDKRFV